MLFDIRDGNLCLFFVFGGKGEGGLFFFFYKNCKSENEMNRVKMNDRDSQFKGKITNLRKEKRL